MKLTIQRKVLTGRLKPWQAYVVTIVATVATLGIRLALERPLGGQPTLVMFTLPIMLSAYLGGLRAGLFATALTYFLASYFLLAPIHSFAVASGVDRWQQFFVALSGVVVSVLNEVLHRTRRRADVATRLREMADEALLKAAPLQSAIFNSANFSSIATDAKGVIQIFNVGAERMLGYTAVEVVNKITPAEISDPQELVARAAALSVEFGTPIAPGFEALIFKASRGIEDIYELTKLRKDGSRFPAVVSVTALRDGHDGVIGYLLIGTDNTARKQAEEARRMSEARIAGIVNSAMDAVISIDAAQRIVLFNTAAEKMFRCNAVDAMQQSIERFIPHRFHEQHRRHVENFGTTGVTSRSIRSQATLSGLRSDGEEFPIEASISQVEVAGQKTFTLIVRDVTERNRTEAVIRESEEYFRFLNDLAEATRMLADPEQIMAVMAQMLGQHLHASRCAYADVDEDGDQFTILKDYTDGCASAKGGYQLSHFGARAVNALHSGQTLIIRSMEAELLAGDGADTFNAIGIKAIVACPLVKEGRLRAMLAVHQSTPRDWKPGEIAMVQDVAERCWASISRRAAEEKIHQFNAELEQRVIERTAQLLTANNESEAFSFSVSHDLRAPLRSLDGFSQALMEDCADKLDAEDLSNLQRIRNASQRMGHLIDDLLNLSRLSRADLNRETVDLSKLAREVVDELRAAEPARDANCVIAEGLVAESDPRLLRIALTNLLSNAWKFTAKCRDARIEFGSAGEDGNKAFFVRDNGVGFDMAHAGKLFGAFQRLHAMTEFPGTGIGLVTVQRIVHRHGGRIWAESAVNAGATFHFTLN